ncbi:MAG TPA: tRNA (adenosine(37)-N6)-threonylcarbamoyltransferase complex ATPase subunit type 1 TsaE [Candidatus Avacidaminococcus intestinavium]|uniref:tRNA threonylcarbamoyladenosine biosynthesis protein TsaE n=1 Tax=Candidatus Avacidaminococcus intestinavium TaxID=2840684 RepID=A0A9D1MPC8_9FIRM|nr:tRNA (adenosine(37)-N6)-threonylcarbamoyltransferase complex ATPase subunit type 1 TsaE [Candidatus Avacidaminococcus intestinavium]
MKQVYCSNEAETEHLGRVIGSLLQDGDVICLSGDLGAGKTVFARGIAKALGADENEISSPTFAIMNVYQGKNEEIRHFDLFRLNSPNELNDIGFNEYVGGYGITIIEWADLFPEELPEEYLSVMINVQGTGRIVSLEYYGAYYEMLLEKVNNNADTSY